jgi:hypothetical protein
MLYILIYWESVVKTTNMNNNEYTESTDNEEHKCRIQNSKSNFGIALYKARKIDLCNKFKNLIPS